MVDSDNTPGGLAGNPVEQYVVEIKPDKFLHIYRMRRGCTCEQRLAVLAELRKQFPAAPIAMIGDEIAVGRSRFK